MPETIKTGAILIKEGTFLAEGLRFESEPYALGWSLVKNLAGCGWSRIIKEAGWTFFWSYEIGATVFGLDEQRTLRKAVEQILAKLESKEFNSLEIMRVGLVASKCFLGVCCATVSAHPQHIQESAFLFRAKDPQVTGRAQAAAA